MGSVPADAAIPPPPTAGRPVPPFSERHEAQRAGMREFVETELRPRAAGWERAGSFPDEVFGWCARRGYLGLKYDPAYGGAGDVLAAVVFAEELARCGSGGLAAGIGAHTDIATPPIARFGSEEQRRRYLVPAIRGELIGALAITEPDAGSDVASLRTRARRVDGGYVVDGAKTFITNGVRADFLVTAVRTKGQRGHHGISFLVIDADRPGVRRSKLDKLGWHASDTAEIAFDGVEVPEGNLLGPEHEGFKLIMANFQWERLMMALGAVAAMEHTLERTVELLRARRGAGGDADAGQATRHALAELDTAVHAGRALTYHALRRHLDGEDAVAEVTMAKLLTQRAAFELGDRCMQVLGIDGVLPEHGIERAARDARLGPIGGGTDEIMREVLGRLLIP